MKIAGTSCPGYLVLGIPAPGSNRVKSLSQKIEVVTRWIIIHLEICLKALTARADRTYSLMVQFNRSIPGTCSLVHTKLR